jgi:hypothetical protein
MYIPMFVSCLLLTLFCSARNSLFSAVHPLLKFIGRYTGCYVSLIATALYYTDEKLYFTAYVGFRPLSSPSTLTPSFRCPSLPTGHGGAGQLDRPQPKGLQGWSCETVLQVYPLALGAEGVLPGRYIVSLLRVFEQFTHLIPSEQMLSSFKTYSPL